MTNPNNAVGTNGAYGGRTSVNAFNDNLAVYSGRGILSGWACEPSSGMTVALGGDGEHRDVAIAEDPIGNRTTINNISEAPVEVTIAAAPATNSRIDSIVAYVVRPPQGSASEVDNPAAVGLIAVSGTVAGTPTAPDDNAIRTAITADGAAGTTAYYVVLANITVANGTTVITSTEIAAGDGVTLDQSILGEKFETVTTRGYFSSIQSTTNTTGVDVGQLYSGVESDGTDMSSIPVSLPYDTKLVVMASFPLSASSGNAFIDLYIDGTKFSNMITNNEQYSHSTWGVLKTSLLSKGSHTIGFKLRASNNTAYIGAYRTIAVSISAA